MKFGPAVAAGVVMGVIGAVIWAAIAHFAHLEIGWIAWGIGGAVGAVMAVVAQKTGPQLGVVAVVITILSIVGGKYAAVQAAVKNAVAEAGDWTASFEHEEYLVSLLADAEIVRRTDAGEPISWPAGVNPDEAAAKADYPADVWTVADSAWAKMSADQRSQFKTDQIAATRASMDAIISSVTSEGFKESFGAMDLLFFGLAIVTAFQLSGRQQSEASA